MAAEGEGRLEERAYRAIERSLERISGEASVVPAAGGRSYLRFPAQAPCPVDVRAGERTARGRLRALLWEFDPARGHPDHALAAIFERMDLSDAASEEDGWLVFEASLPCRVEVELEGGETIVGELRAYRWPLER